jgi:RNA polymerase sigma-70 factor (ECF subfamily)
VSDLRSRDEDDAVWVRRAQAGDAQAFERLVMAHQHFVFNLALRVLADPHEAEDVAQDAFVRAWSALPRFRGQSKFSTWLYRITTNLCYNRLPRLRRELNALVDDDLAEVPDDRQTDAPEAQVEDARRQAFLQQALADLPTGQRLLLSLRFQQALSYEDIATVTGLPLGTVKTGLFRARARLRDAWLAHEAPTHDPRA